MGLDLIPILELTIYKNKIIQGGDLDFTKDYKILDSSNELQGDVISAILVRKGDKPSELNISTLEPLSDPTLVDDQHENNQKGLPSRNQDEASHLPADSQTEEPLGSRSQYLSAETLSSDFQVICLSEAVTEEISKISNPDLVTLLNKFQSIFSQYKFDIGRISIEKCKINLNSDALVNKRPYPTSASDQMKIQT